MGEITILDGAYIFLLRGIFLLKISGKIQYKSAILVDDSFLEDVDKLLCEYFDVPRYEAKLFNGDKITFDSVLELVNYDNFSHRRIASLEIGVGYNNLIEIKPTYSYINAYTSTIEMSFEVDSIDKVEEIKRKMRTIIDKHKQPLLYTVASKLSFMHLLVLTFCTSMMFSIWQFVNYGLTNTEIDYMLLLPICIVAAAFAVILGNAFAWLIKTCFPPVEFYLGENKTAVERKRDIKGKVFWGIVVTTIISYAVSKFV